MTWLLYVFAAYLACCYVWAIYLVIRLYTGKRLRVLLFGGRGDATREVVPTTTAGTYAPPRQTTAPQRKAAA